MQLHKLLRLVTAVALFATSSAVSVRRGNTNIISPRQNADKNLVFCHFMVRIAKKAEFVHIVALYANSTLQIGIVGARTSAADYDADMKRAKAAGIDAFALNIGVDPYTDQQLQLAYESAANNGMKVFISFDFNWFHPNEASRVGQMIATYGSKPAQLKVDNKIFASSFAGDGLDVNALRQAAGTDVFFAPNFHPEQGTDFGGLDGALNWMGWDNNGNNKAPSPDATVSVQDGDNAYNKALGGKAYIAPVSPWFSTHFGAEVPYSKNWVFPGDFLWYDRWQEILKLQPRFLEIITWNDYGESHYIGRLDSPHGDDGNSKWVYGYPHNGWLDMAAPFIAAYHDGASDPAPYIKDDKIVYWFRPTLKSLDCDATDTTMGDANNSSGNYFKGRPNGYETMEDKVFVVTLLKEAGSLLMSAGGKTQTVDAPAGAAKFSIDMAPGQVSFKLTRGGSSVLGGKAGMEVLDHCPCGIYNFNAYVGTLPAGDADELQPAGYASISAGLKVSTCGPNVMKATGLPARVA